MKLAIDVMIENLTNPLKGKIYFASDIHLGLYPPDKSRKREKLFVQWLDEIKNDASELYLLGDIFDFWYEYRKVVPRGFTRVLGKICEFTDKGIPVHYFTGNHDVWVFDYLPSETGVIIHHKPFITEIYGKKFFLAHGDDLGFEDIGYKFLKRCFTNKTLQWMFSKLHPNFALSIGHAWSRKSRYSKGIAEEFKGEDKELQILFAKATLKKEHFDYFIFGHRHIAMDYKLSDNSKLINLGEWIFSYTYAVYDGNDVQLKKYIN
jgi:UDP-2,3-diacylglucosamine hydrolase